MRHLKFTIAYDGSDFSGWQSQKNNRNVQDTLEAAWLLVTGESRRMRGASRTDAGVHAEAQAVSMETECKLSGETLRRALNDRLPPDVVVLLVQEAPHGFHATRDAVGKRYRYIIQQGRVADVFSRRYAWFVPKILDIDAMREAAQHLIGEYDFASFQSSGSVRKSTVRKIHELTVSEEIKNNLPRIVLEVAGNGFLYNMVRSIAGTLVKVGRGTRPASWVEEVLAARDRREAGMTAPAQGLFLVSVDFGEIEFHTDHHQALAALPTSPPLAESPSESSSF